VLEKTSESSDSTGLRFSLAGGWYEKKYGKAPDRTPWRKLHIGMDSDWNIHAVKVTESDVGDGPVLDELMPTDLPIDKILADGAYYDMTRNERLLARGITPVIPPPANAVIHGDGALHDRTVQCIKDKETIYAWHKKYGYGLRSRFEAQFSRIKRCIGRTLLTQRDESQNNEVIITANIINLWNSFGRPVSVKVA
jgi:Transposase DDE domain